MTETRAQAVVFDLDGTLVDSRLAVVDAVARGVREVCSRHGHGDVDVDPTTLRAALGQPAGRYFRSILPDALADLAPEVQQVSTEHEVAALRDGHGRLFDGVLATLDVLRHRGVRLACISNAQAPYFRAALEHLDLEPHFAHTECHDELPAGAPEPYKTTMLRRALDVLDLDPADAIMVGDRAEDLRSGREVGCRTVGVTFGFGTAEELSIAHARIDRFGDLLTVL